jgi:hypothetical protein
VAVAWLISSPHAALSWFLGFMALATFFWLEKHEWQVAKLTGLPLVLSGSLWLPYGDLVSAVAYAIAFVLLLLRFALIYR